MGGKNPIVLEVEYADSSLEDVQLKAAADLGPVLLNGYGNAIHIVAPMDTADTELDILQSARLRFSKADYGYVGAAAGRISLYRNKECVEKNIPQEEAIPRLITLIKADGRWHDPA